MIPEIDKDIIQMFYELIINKQRNLNNTPECIKKPIMELLDKNNVKIDDKYGNQ